MATEATPQEVQVNRRWRYHDTLHSVPKLMSEIMSAYSGVSEHEQISHITKVRNEAYAQFPYPCMGTFRFLELDLSRHDAYEEHVLGPLRQPAVPGKPEPLFLDCGCCLGQDIRKLAVDGVPPERLWASDIEPRFIELGFELFRDGHKLPRDHFLCPGNLLAEAGDPSEEVEDRLTVLDDRVTVLNITAVFHLFDLDEQKRIAHRCLRLLRKDSGDDQPVLVLGAQVGGREAQRVRRAYNDKFRYVHTAESWEALWREVCGQPRWRDRVAAVEVRSRMLEGARERENISSSGDGDAANNQHELVAAAAASDADPAAVGGARLWQRFEVWVTFKS
ncbi:hypothetical protein F5Y14DRAFT_410765 [Nemania sp. NC0429]|nr:hypothetical protein F5Y14DRAFT_410765 [Nemania sp. NC0429]